MGPRRPFATRMLRWVTETRNNIKRSHGFALTMLFLSFVRLWARLTYSNIITCNPAWCRRHNQRSNTSTDPSPGVGMEQYSMVRVIEPQL